MSRRAVEWLALKLLKQTVKVSALHLNTSRRLWVWTSGCRKEEKREGGASKVDADAEGGITNVDQHAHNNNRHH